VIFCISRIKDGEYIWVMSDVDMVTPEQCLKSLVLTVVMRLKFLSALQRVDRSTVESVIKNIGTFRFISNYY
jgi:hypothetical protein